MDKYSVEVDSEELQKTAADGAKCPKCGGALPSRGPNGNGDVTPPWYCPNCGTEPFEKRPGPQLK